MPGPVSDSYDPVFGTHANLDDVRDAMLSVRVQITDLLGEDLKNIVEVAQSDNGRDLRLRLCEREWRLVRFALDTALEAILS